jgi:putative tryptophan/tyrosine transport system substrate-binding protein
VKRRQFIVGLGGAVAWPVVARAQQPERMRRIGLLPVYDENDPEGKRRVSAFTQALSGLGWTDGRNVRMELRWGGNDSNRIRTFAQELVGLQPDVIVTGGGAATAALKRETQTIPIVFMTLADPVASGRLDRPSGNITGFTLFEASMGGKWLELLSKIAPGLKRAAIMFNPDFPAASTYMSSLKTVAQSLKVLPINTPVHSDVEIETAISALGREPGGGLVVIQDQFTETHRVPIILAAARNNIPAVYSYSPTIKDGGLLSYGVDQVDTWRRVATYVDRILRGAKTTDLPVQLPTKFEMIINLKAARALGLTIPETLLATADEVIQ